LGEAGALSHREGAVVEPGFEGIVIRNYFSGKEPRDQLEAVVHPNALGPLWVGLGGKWREGCVSLQRKMLTKGSKNISFSRDRRHREDGVEDARLGLRERGEKGASDGRKNRTKGRC